MSDAFFVISKFKRDVIEYDVNSSIPLIENPGFEFKIIVNLFEPTSCTLLLTCKALIRTESVIALSISNKVLIISNCSVVIALNSSENDITCSCKSSWPVVTLPAIGFINKFWDATNLCSIWNVEELLNEYPFFASKINTYPLIPLVVCKVTSNASFGSNDDNGGLNVKTLLIIGKLSSVTNPLTKSTSSEASNFGSAFIVTSSFVLTVNSFDISTVEPSENT